MLISTSKHLNNKQTWIFVLSTSMSYSNMTYQQWGINMFERWVLPCLCQTTWKPNLTNTIGTRTTMTNNTCSGNALHGSSQGLVPLQCSFHICLLRYPVPNSWSTVHKYSAKTLQVAGKQINMHECTHTHMYIYIYTYTHMYHIYVCTYVYIDTLYCIHAA